MRHNLKRALRALSAPALFSLLLIGCSGAPSQEVLVTDEAGKELSAALIPEESHDTKENEDGDQYDKLQAVWTLWQNAVRDGAYDSAIETLKLVALDPAPELSGMAKKAIADLRRLKQKQKTATVETGNGVSPQEMVPTAASVSPDDRPNDVDTENVGTAEYIKSLSLLMQNEKDIDKRTAAVHEIGLHRNDAAVEALTISASDADAGIRYRALQKLWFSAADGLDTDGGITTALELALSDSDPQVASLAQQALTDLRQLKERNEADTESAYMDNSAQELAEVVNAMPGPDGRLPVQVSAATVNESMETEEFIEKMDELATRARFGVDTEERSSAVNELGQYRTDESVDLLTEAAADADPGIRYQALKTLWYSAADGLDNDEAITDTLQRSTTDSDPRVAELAQQALDDLKKLEETKHQQLVESYSSSLPEEIQNQETAASHPPQ